MTNEELIRRITAAIRAHPKDPSPYEDLLSLSIDLHEIDFDLAHNTSMQVKEAARNMLRECNPSDAERFYLIYRNGLLFDAPYDLDSYAIYLEIDREPKKKFYAPRRKQLRTVVKSLQDLLDDRHSTLDILSISLPPGVGKTTLALITLTWLAGKYPDEANLTCSHSNSFIRGAYAECLRFLDPNGEYLFKDVFPGVGVVNTNANDCRIDLGTRKRFDTLEFTSTDARNAGLHRAERLLYCDDLVPGISVALNKDQLDKLWTTYTDDLCQRKKGDHCKELHIATRWSVWDVIGRLERMHQGKDRARFITIPALDENDESNFDYAYGVGFSTDAYRAQRELMEDASWRAIYQNEPIEREGLVYHPDELRRFFELPEGDPDAVVSVCDTKDRGDDYAVLPVGYIYGKDVYIADCICDNGLPDKVDIRLADILVRDNVGMSRFESNSAGGKTAEKVQKQVKELGGNTHITTRFSIANKETRILISSAYVKEHFLFLDNSKFLKNSDYGRMMDMLCTYTVSGKNKHDDVPDAMAMLADFIQSLAGIKAEIIQRPF